ncbi:hypothetical protein AB0J28_00640 [Streptosporangium canum]|uniref:hypothetical protein n=1 Tax=Streptosporangium canum TaxID=324952 RepID=UPI00341CAE05
MSKRYKVTAPCVANVPVSAAPDASMTIFYKDALLPEGVPAERLRHLLDGNMIEEIKGNEAAEQQKAEEKSSTPTQAPASGGQGVNSRSSKAELVDHGVAQGGDRAELEKLTHKELQDRYLKQAPQQ